MTDLSKCCVQCKNQRFCAYLVPIYTGFYCPGMEAIIDNRKPRREPLVSDLYEGEIATEDYKDVLNRMAESKTATNEYNEHKIRNMPMKDVEDIKRKAIACMTYFGIEPKWIMQILSISRATFYKIVKK